MICFISGYSHNSNCRKVSLIWEILVDIMLAVLDQTSNPPDRGLPIFLVK